MSKTIQQIYGEEGNGVRDISVVGRCIIAAFPGPRACLDAHKAGRQRDERSHGLKPCRRHAYQPTLTSRRNARKRLNVVKMTTELGRILPMRPLSTDDREGAWWDVSPPI